MFSPLTQDLPSWLCDLMQCLPPRFEDGVGSAIVALSLSLLRCAQAGPHHKQVRGLRTRYVAFLQAGVTTRFHTWLKIS